MAVFVVFVPGWGLVAATASWDLALWLYAGVTRVKRAVKQRALSGRAIRRLGQHLTVRGGCASLIDQSANWT